MTERIDDPMLWSVCGRQSKSETADEDPATDTHWKGAAPNLHVALKRAREEAGIFRAFWVVPEMGLRDPGCRVTG